MHLKKPTPYSHLEEAKFPLSLPLYTRQTILILKIPIISSNWINQVNIPILANFHFLRKFLTKQRKRKLKTYHYSFHVTKKQKKKTWEIFNSLHFNSINFALNFFHSFLFFRSFVWLEWKEIRGEPRGMGASLSNLGNNDLVAALGLSDIWESCIAHAPKLHVFVVLEPCVSRCHLWGFCVVDEAVSQLPRFARFNASWVIPRSLYFAIDEDDVTEDDIDGVSVDVVKDNTNDIHG